MGHVAHAGGLAAGLVIGYIYYPILRNPKKQRLFYVTLAAASVFVGIASFILVSKTPRDMIVYHQKMQDYDKMRSAALDADDLSSDSSRQQWLNGRRDTALYYWNMNIRLLTEVKELNISAGLRGRTGRLVDYCQLNLQRDSYMYRKMLRTIPVGSDSIPIYNDLIRQIHADRNHY
jgi:rhomboid protease GluP